MIAQAGAIAVRGTGADTEILIVRPKRSPTEWIFPKGHVETGETLAEAAVRELREEAGVDGSVVGAVGESTYTRDGTDIHVTYFLVRFAQTVTPAEWRERRWCPLDEARELVTFKGARRLVDVVERLLARDGS